MTNETWEEIIERHEAEKRDVLQKLSDQGYTQTEAARILKTTLQQINNQVRRNKIQWKTIRQGVQSREIQN